MTNPLNNQEWAIWAPSLQSSFFEKTYKTKEEAQEMIEKIKERIICFKLEAKESI